MKEIRGKKIDELFKNSLSEPEISFQQEHWEDMKRMLERKNNSRPLFIWLTTGSVAAMFILVIALWGSSKDESAENQVQLIKEQKSESLSNRLSVEKTIKNKTVQTGEQSVIIASYANIGKKNFQFNRTVSTKDNQKTASDIEQTTEISLYITEQFAAKDLLLLPVAPDKQLSKADAINRQDFQNAESDYLKSGENLKFKPELTLSLVAAPDINGVGSFKDNQAGLGAGILATLSVSPKLSITTGAGLAKKLYATGFNNYNPESGYVFPVNPNSVSADCRVLDIPLNINYTTWKKESHKLGLTLGVSSYIMLRESYDFTYQNTYTRSPKHYEVKNENQHFMGIANIGITYTKQLNTKFSIGIQPYMKLPLTKIGYGNINLQSTGVAVSFNYNLLHK